MTTENELYIIYRFCKGQESLHYQILRCFDVNTIMQDKMKEGFNTKEELVGEVMTFLESSEYRHAYLLSVTDYNLAMEQVHQSEDFKQMFVKAGQKIQVNKKKSSLFHFFGA